MIDHDIRPPRLGLGPGGIALRAAAVIAILFASQFVTMPITAMLQGSPSFSAFMERPSLAALGVVALLQGGVCAAVVLGSWVWMRFVERRRLRDVGLRLSPASPLWLLLGTVVSASLLLAARLPLPATGPVGGADDAYASVPLGLVIGSLLIQAFVLQGFPEELLFRGVLLGALGRRPILAIAVSTAAFTVIHLVSSGGQQSAFEHVVYLANPLGFALLAVGLLLWTRSLWAAVGVHGGFHVGNALAFALLPEADRVLSWVAVGGVQTVVGLALIAAALRRGRGIPSSGEWR